MSPAPRISIVVPAYNHERFVGEALASVREQAFEDFEVVVVDDGSRDGTAAVADGFAALDARFSVIRQANGGSHAAINRGVRESRAPWVAILNSDDRFAPGRLARLDEEARAGARFVVTGVRLIDDAGREIVEPGHWWLTSVGHFRAKAKELGPVDGLLYGNYTVSTSNFFFSRELFDAVGPMRPLRYVIDWEWALRAALHAPHAMRYLADEPLLDYRLHGSNTILRGALRGACEVNRLHRELLARYGAPAPVVAALFRNQRLLRRNWRAAGEQTAERHVRAREADVAQLQARLADTERHLRDREADVASVRERAEVAEGFVRQREADVAELARREAAYVEQLARQQARAEGLEAQVRAVEALALEREAAIRAQQATLAARDAELAELRARLDAIESSLAWRTLKRVRALTGTGSR